MTTVKHSVRISGAIMMREFNAFFQTPVGWMCLLGFSLINGLIFSWIAAAYSDPITINTGQAADLNSHIIPEYFGTLSIILILLSPALSMRSFSEDLKTKSFELLLSSPIKSSHIVIGKFLGIALFAIVLLSTTLPCIILLFRLSDPSLSIVCLNYLSCYLMILSCCAIGLAISAWTSNQLISLSLTFIMVMTLWFMMGIAPLFSGTTTQVIAYISLLSHIDHLSKGLLHTRDIVYFLSFILFFLYLCQQRIEAYRWM